MAEQTTPDDRPFAEVAERLALWPPVQDAATPGYFLRAWALAGCRVFYVEQLPYPAATLPNRDSIAANLLPLAFLPAWASSAAPAYRDGILKAFARQWDAEGREDAIERFWHGLAWVLADELGRAAAPGV
jgi:hypothetical protein